MDEVEVEKAVEERRIWLLHHLEMASRTLDVEPVGPVVNTYDMRSAGRRARDGGSDLWLRVVLEDPDYQPACRWEGNVEANAIHGVPKPRLLRWVDWQDDGPYGQGCRLRGEVMTFAHGTPVASDCVLRADPRLPNSWWDSLSRALMTLAAHPVPKGDPVETVQYTIDSTQRHFGVVLDRTVFSGVIWTTAHADLHWGNLVGPELCILDWESWRRAPAGYDAATLYCNSLLHPSTAQRVYDIFRSMLDTHSGQVAMLFAVCRYLWTAKESGEYRALGERLHALGTTVIDSLDPGRR